MPASWFSRAIVLTFSVATLNSLSSQELMLPDLPDIRESAGIVYVSGGIGTDEVARMRELAPSFNVRIRFQEEVTGASLSDVKVVVLNEKSERLLRLETEGPLLYMKMPPGRYLMAMAYQHTVKKRIITVGRAARSMTFAFPESEQTTGFNQARDGLARHRKQAAVISRRIASLQEGARQDGETAPPSPERRG